MKYTIGVDFGSLSGRAVMVEVETGKMIGQVVCDYPHAVMDAFLPDGTPLEMDYALQDAMDYVYVLKNTIPQLMEQTCLEPEDVIGIGTDFTACTVLPIDKNGLPLSENPVHKSNPHAYVKLWKHHAAQKYANDLNRIGQERGEAFLSRYGGKISSEWVVPKAMQIAKEAPEIYAEMDRFIEAADWIVMQLCGEEKRNSCTAGYKAIWHKAEGYPGKDFFKALDPSMENFVEDKLSLEIYPLGGRAGQLTEKMAKDLGLKAGTAVSIGNVDAHVSIPAVGITRPGQMLMIIGTSTCDILLSDHEAKVPGICGVVEDGVLPGFYGYESGQSCVGDGFDWFVSNLASAESQAGAKEAGVDIHRYLTDRAAQLRPGQSGLLALDWFNGNRSVLVDVDLTGLVLGMNLQTKDYEIYRALIEATAYGKRMIIDNFEDHGVPVDELFACGGISWKNPFMMQVYADVCNKPIKISASDQTPALGAAMFGAVAAGKAAGGYDSIFEAAGVMGKVKDKVYEPIPDNVKVYEALYQEYKLLHDYFGRGENDVMKRLKAIKESIV